MLVWAQPGAFQLLSTTRGNGKIIDVFQTRRSVGAGSGWWRCTVVARLPFTPSCLLTVAHPWTASVGSGAPIRLRVASVDMS